MNTCVVVDTLGQEYKIIFGKFEKSLDFSFNITYNYKHKRVVMLKGVKNGLQTD